MKLVINDLLNEEGFIKPEYTCDGSDASPRMEWSEASEGAECFAVYCHDPDAPGGNWIHWIVINIPGRVNEIGKNGPIAEGSEEVTNDFGRKSYGGPCPPSGTHRYYYKVYALNKELEDVTKENFLRKVEGAKLDEAEVMGRYER